MSENILAAIDGSEHSGKVVEFAADLAKARGATLRLVHVIPPGSIPKGLEQWAAAEHVTDPPAVLYAQSVGERILDSVIKNAEDRGVDKVERMVARGEPVKEILSIAEAEDTDVIVVGSRGLSDLQGLVLGSVAHKLSHLAQCSVVTVR